MGLESIIYRRLDDLQCWRNPCHQEIVDVRSIYDGQGYRSAAKSSVAILAAFVLLDTIEPPTVAVPLCKLKVGLLQPNDPADFIIIDNLKDFNVKMTVINGEVVAENGTCFLEPKKHAIINNFNTSA